MISFILFTAIYQSFASMFFLIIICYVNHIFANFVNSLHPDINVREFPPDFLKAEAFCDWIGVKNVSWLERMRRKRIGGK